MRSRAVGCSTACTSANWRASWLSISRILLVRQDGIGDALALTPLIAALIDAGHTLGAVLSTPSAGLFAASTFERVHVTERIPWPRHGSTPETLEPALREIAGARYDAALIASEEPEAYRIAYQARIPHRIGFWHAWEKPLKSIWIRSRCTSVVFRTVREGSERAHEADVLYRLGKRFTHAPIPRDAERLARVVLDAPVERSGGIVLQASPKWRAMGFDDEGLGRVIDALAPSAVTIVGVAADVDALHALARPGIAFAPTHAVAEWKRRIAGAAVLITPDTGAAHIAGMTGTPCVDVFPRERFAVDAPRWRPFASPARTLAARGAASADEIAAAVADLGGAA